jgi:hypothetical protein
MSMPGWKNGRFLRYLLSTEKNTQSQRVVPHSRKLSLLDLSWSIGLMPGMCSPLILIYQTLEGG